MASLIVLSGSTYGRAYPVIEPVCILGRSAECQASDLLRYVYKASRRHAEIRRMREGFVLTDCSRHGTQLNRRLLAGPAVIRDGDRICICGVELQFRETDDVDSTRIGQEAAELTHFTENDENPSIESSIQLDAALNAAAGQAPRHSSEGRLQVLVELLSSLGMSLELKEVLERILDGVLRVFPEAESGFVGLKQGGQEVRPAAVAHRNPKQRVPVRVSRSILEHVMARREGVRLSDVWRAAPPGEMDSAQRAGVRSGLCVPLLDAGGISLGVLQVDTTDPAGQFRHEDLVVLAALARLVTVAVQHAELHAHLLEHERAEHELEMARQMQASLLPAQPPKFSGYDFYTFYKPAYEVGGDYYDFVSMPDGRLAIIVADAAGKGVSAALLMMTVSGVLRSCLEGGLSPSAAMARANRHIRRSDYDVKFVTLVMAVLDPRSEEVAIVNAGHPHPFLRLDPRDVVSVSGDEPCYPLGVHLEEEYHEQRMSLVPGNPWSCSPTASATP